MHCPWLIEETSEPVNLKARSDDVYERDDHDSSPGNTISNLLTTTSILTLQPDVKHGRFKRGKGSPEHKIENPLPSFRNCVAYLIFLIILS